MRILNKLQSHYKREDLIKRNEGIVKDDNEFFNVNDCWQ